MSALSAALEVALLRRLQQEHAGENWRRFGSALRMPVIRLTDSNRLLAAWCNGIGTLEVSRRLLLNVPWASVVEVLKHEMAHQFVEEVLRIQETPHGPVFQSVCRERGIDAAAHGVPKAASAPGDEAIDRVRQKVRRLLALAASDNPHEAELAMLRAREILLRHNLESIPANAEYEVRWLGKPKKRVSAAEYALGAILRDHFHVEVIWIDAYLPLEGKSATVLEVCGTNANVEMAEYVYVFLLGTAKALYDARKKKVGSRARQAFVAGVMHGFREKLEAQAKTLTGAGLVWAGDASLRELHDRRHPRRRSTGGSGTSMWGAHLAGRKEGSQIVLSRPIASGPSGRTRLLPP